MVVSYGNGVMKIRPQSIVDRPQQSLAELIIFFTSLKPLLFESALNSRLWTVD